MSERKQQTRETAETTLPTLRDYVQRKEWCERGEAEKLGAPHHLLPRCDCGLDALLASSGVGEGQNQQVITKLEKALALNAYSGMRRLIREAIDVLTKGQA